MTAAAVVASAGACTVDTSTSTSKHDKSAADQENNVRQGAGFRLGDFRVLPGWRITKDPYVGYSVKGLRVKNVTSGSHNFFVDVRLYSGGKNQIADINCNTDTVNPGVTMASVNCVPDGDSKQPFKRITFANSF